MHRNAKSIDFDPFSQGTLDAAFPLTEAQQGIWFSTRLGEQASIAYIESMSVDLNGSLDLKILAESVRLLVARHQALRSTVSPSSGHVCVAPEMRLEIPVAAVDPSKRKEFLEKMISTEMATPFNLTKGPLFRAQILEFGPKDHTLIFSAHHIVCDGWSLDVLLSDIAALYSGLKTGQSASLKPAPRLSDFALLLQKEKTSGARRKAETFWLERFKQEPLILELPLKHERPSERTFEASFARNVLSKSLISMFKKKLATMRCSLFSGLLAAWSITLRRISGQSDIVIGIPLAKQPIYGMNDLVGNCVSVLPFRIRLKISMKVSDYLPFIGNALLDAVENHQAGWGELMEIAHFKRDPSRVPLIPVCFTYTQKYSPDKVAFAGCSMDYRLNPRKGETFEIHLNAIESADGLELHWHYNSSLFDRDSILQWAEQLKNVIEEILENPSASIGPMNSALKNGNGDDSDKPAPLQHSVKVMAAGGDFPETQEEIFLAECWKKVLNIASVNKKDNFFRLGGNSIGCVRLIADIETKTGIRLHPRVFLLDTLGQIANGHLKGKIIFTRDNQLESRPSSAPIEARPDDQLGFRAFYFGESNKRCLAFYHAPDSSSEQKAAGIVLCGPIFQEYIRSYNALRLLAERLSLAGFPVIRFDYFNHGDSFGESSEGGVTEWLDNIVSASMALKEKSGVSDISLVGLRFGASLAAALCEKGFPVKDIILWDPVITGSSYLKNLAAMHESVCMGLPFKGKRTRDGRELLGFLYTRAVLDQIESIDVLSMNLARAGRMALIVSENDDRFRALGDILSANRKDFSMHVQPDGGEWNDAKKIEDILMVDPIIDKITDVLSRQR